MKWVGIWLVLVTPACAWEGLNNELRANMTPMDMGGLAGNSRENADCEYVDQDELHDILTSIRGIRFEVYRVVVVGIRIGWCTNDGTGDAIYECVSERLNDD